MNDFGTCRFTVVTCKNECGCEGGGCDCDSIQAKLTNLRLQLESENDRRFAALVALLEKNATTNNDLDLMELIQKLREELKLGVVVNLGDDIDISIENRTTEILLLLAELRAILREMKHCINVNPELIAELKSLANTIIEELGARRGAEALAHYGLTTLSDLSAVPANDQLLAHELSPIENISMAHSLAELFDDGDLGEPTNPAVVDLE